MPFQIKRIYEAPAGTDGRRMLVDRLWPRGVTKERAALDGWLKDVAPSPELRQWFGHKPERFDEFSQRYRRELELDPEKQLAITELLSAGRAGMVSLLYAAKSLTVNHAAVLKAFLDGKK